VKKERKNSEKRFSSTCLVLDIAGSK